MFGAKAYAQVGLESGVNSASPHGLILMLYDGAIESIKKAVRSQIDNKPDEKGVAIGKALRIIDEGLKAAVDKDAGGDLANQLLMLYDFIGKELLLATSKKDVDRMNSCILLLEDLRSAWVDIGQTKLNDSLYQI